MKIQNFWPLIVVAALGYMVDVCDLILFTVVRLRSLRDMGLSEQALLDAGVRLMNYQMLGLMVGGIAFGVLGDKFGRRSVLFGSILLYSLANLANAFVQDINTYAFLRFVAGIGLAGELGAGVTLISEILPPRLRGWGTTMIAAIGALGAFLAGYLATVLSWQHAYFAGGAVGLLLLFLRLGTSESALFQKTRQAGVSRGNFLSFFTSRSLFKRFLGSILIGVPIWYAAGLLLTLAPEFGQALNLQAPVDVGRCVFFSYAGMVLGDVLCGALSQILKSRRKPLAIFLALDAATFILYFSAHGLSVTTFYCICTLVGVTSGYFAVLTMVGTEQFGTNLRATAAISIPNFVRGTVVVVNGLFLALKPSFGVLHSGAVLGVLVLILAFIGVSLIRETYGISLDFQEA